MVHPRKYNKACWFLYPQRRSVTFSLDPKECFFIDDLEKNINAARSLGMDGIVFNGNIDDVKKAIGF